MIEYHTKMFCKLTNLLSELFQMSKFSISPIFIDQYSTIEFPNSEKTNSCAWKQKCLKFKKEFFFTWLSSAHETF